ncbi:MAG: class F sortase [Acidimicrobiia bacterium]|nr:class F sortase [Acidimicrobiia bacterium]
MTRHGLRWPLVVLSTTAVGIVIFGSATIAGGESGNDSIEMATTTTSVEVADELARTTTTTTNGPPGTATTAVAPAPEVTNAGTTDSSVAEANTDNTGVDLTPLRVRIPSIEVDAPIIDLGLNPDRTIEVPSDFDDTGWYTGRSVPGEIGPGVVVGHVDSRRGPAVFFRLRELTAGDVILVDRSDGRVAWFEVTDVVLVKKDAFPTEAVYGGTEAPTLRVITCGGEFDRDERSYLGNLIVYAEHLGNFEGPGSRLL